MLYKAGKELDRLVAEKMGINLKLTTDEEILEAHIANYRKPIKRYSTSFAAAFDVVDWLTKHGFCITIRSSCVDAKEPSAIECVIYRGDRIQIIVTSKQRKFPLAICNAFMALDLLEGSAAV